MIHRIVRLDIVKATALTAACVMAISGAALAIPHTKAQTPASALSSLRPGQSEVTLGPPATITSTVHYQAEIVLTCSGSSCIGNFPNAGAHHLLTVTRMSCFLSVSTTAIPRTVTVVATNAAVTRLIGEAWLPFDFSNQSGDWVVDAPMDLQFAGGQHLLVNADFFGDANGNASCSATGTLSSLG